MNYANLLTKAGVPQELQLEALSSLDKAKNNSKWLNLKKWYVRLFKANKISKILSWEDNRLIEVDSTKLDWDIAPMLNITANGDNPEWSDIDVPNENSWLNKNHESEDYKKAVQACYWCRGSHPRSQKARKAWYRRNAGEGLAYRLGEEVDKSEQLKSWYYSDDKETIQVSKSGKSWIIIRKRKLIGKLGIKQRLGFECDNVFCGPVVSQMWYPIPGYELKAPVTWSTLPCVF